MKIKFDVLEYNFSEKKIVLREVSWYSDVQRNYSGKVEGSFLPCYFFTKYI